MGRRGSVAIAAAAGLAVVVIPGTASAHTARPAEPTGLHVVKVTSSSFTVALSPTAHAKRYRLFASTVRSNLFVQNISNAQKSALSHSPRVRIGGLSGSGSEYYYRVEALNGQRWKFSGAIGEVGLRPAPPAHIRATSSHAKTYVTWNGASASGFEVEQATDPNMGAHTKFYKVRGDSNEFTPYGLNQGRKYYFRVRAMNGSTPSSYSGTTQAVVQTAQQPVRVMTYNIKEAHFDGEEEGGDVVAPWNPDRKEAVARLITRADPDVVGIEEGATKIGHRRHGPRQVDTLRKALGGNYRLARTEVPPNRPGTHRTGDYILYKKATWRAVGKGGHWALGNHRWAAHQVLRNRASGAKFLFVTAHLRQQPGRSNDVLRQRETESLVHHGHQLAARKGVPVVYVGDFNSDPFGNHAYNAPALVMKQHHIADSYNVAQKRVRARYNTANHYMRRPPHVGARIDYIFAPQGVGVRSWKLIMRMHHGEFVGTIPSDHNPVVSDLMIPYNR
jgi:endonuclease/exonuclease/phosphatase family metal-dependent hydrolase